MRTITALLADRDIELAATFGASEDVAKAVGDPLLIVREMGIEAQMQEAGLTYTPKWSFTVANVPKIIHIGMRAAGNKATLAEVQELAFDHGLLEAREVASEYLAALVTPESAAAGSGNADGKK